ncbi:MAG: hypothetical protein E7315_01520 [Clostridiales bacterium]|nr:hypothetical protein [Clostridiales bacterium]
MRKIKIIACVMAFIMILGITPVFHYTAEATEYSGPAINYTRIMTDNVFRYLDEVYIQKHPMLGLRWTYGFEDDKQNITHLAEIITKDCTTDKQKAEAIVGWIQRNITYDASYVGVCYAIDVFYARRTSCVGYAVLMQDLLRMIGIPAVFGDGVRSTDDSNKMGDITVSDVRQMDNSGQGHAWCYAYIDGEWLLYDPLWSDVGTNDREYLSQTYFQATVDNIVPIYDTDIPMREPDGHHVVYNGERFVQKNFSSFEGYLGGINAYINNVMAYHYWFCDCDRNSTVTCGIRHIYEPQRHDEEMITGEAYTNGWISYGGTGLIAYAYENGALAEGVIMEREGEEYLLHHSEAYHIYADKSDFYMQLDTIVVRPGFTGRLVIPTLYFYYEGKPEYNITWASSDPSVISVDQDCNLTVHKEGSAYITFNNNGERIRGFDVWVLDNERTPDFSDNVNAPGGPVLGGDEEECIIHQFSDWEVIEEPTEETEGFKVRSCTVCGYCEEMNIPPVGSEYYPDGGDEGGGDTPMLPDNVIIDEYDDVRITDIVESLVEGETILFSANEGMNAVGFNSEFIGYVVSNAIPMEFEINGVNVNMDDGALYNAFVANSPGKAVVSVAAKGVGELSDQQQQGAGDSSIKAVYSIDVFVGGIDIHGLNGGKASVTFEYEFLRDEDIGQYSVLYLREDGYTELMKTHIEGNKVTFETDHFSDFALVKAGEGNIPQEPNNNDNDYKNITIYAAIGVGVIGAAVAVVITVKKRSGAK